MNFKLAEKLNTLITRDKLDEAITLAEKELRGLPQTPFHAILGKDLLHLVDPMAKYLDAFYQWMKPTLTTKALYAEMNGFTINPDLWYVDVFAYDEYQGLDDLDWLADVELENSTVNDPFVLTGFEDLQEAYDDYMEKEKYHDKRQRSGSEVCELIVILRLQQLMREAVKAGKAKGKTWVKVPLLVTAHDYDLIYRAS